MNTRITFTTIALMIIFLSCTSPTEKANSGEDGSPFSMSNDQEHIFPSSSGMVSFVHDGTMKGTEVWYWSDWGKNQRKETNIVVEMMGFKQEQKKTSIIIGENIYNLNEDQKTATKISSDFVGELSNVKYDDEDFLKEMGGKKIGAETILGKECDIWEIESMMGKVSVWKGLALHTVVDVMGMKSEITADKIDINFKTSDSMFDISQYEIKDMGNVEDYMPGRN
ncbi:MAG: DUF4412 domain-containing protein [Bacteroidota bacterium]